MFEERLLVPRLAAAVLAVFLLPTFLAPTPALGATLYEQTVQDTLAQTYDQHAVTNANPIQGLGNHLTGTARSVVFKVSDPNLATNVAAGWYGALLFKCGTSGYVGCNPSPVASNFDATVQNVKEILVVFSASHTFAFDNYYYLMNVSGATGLGALYGSAISNNVYAGGDMNWSTNNATPSNDLDANVADLAFQICDTTSCSVAVPPVLAIISTSTTVSTPTITGTTTDTAAVDVIINGHTYTATPVGINWSAAVTDALTDGTYTIVTSSTSTEGKTGSATASYLVDTTAPAVSITSGPADGSYASTTLAEFYFTATDTNLLNITCAWDGAATSTCSTSASSTLAQGVHTFTLTATDTVGNAASTTRSVTIDTTAPTLAEGAAIATSTNTTPSYSFTSTEAGTISYGGSCSATTTAAVVGTTTVTFNTLAVGTYSTCTVSVTDAAGNSGILAVSSFVIEAVPPAPAPAPSGGGGGGNGVQGGPLAVGYQTPNTTPAATIPTPPPGTPEPVTQPVVSAPVAAETPEILGAESAKPDVAVAEATAPEPEPSPAPNSAPEEAPATPLAASVMSAGFPLPWNYLLGIVLVVGITGTLLWLRRK
ncbi:hypothetical protein EXS62_01450 [Candidatus Kaiserbacteria bacterium]|nr:hypothetical protein [Candidatus Kaiserbacteria bacterium]